MPDAVNARDARGRDDLVRDLDSGPVRGMATGQTLAWRGIPYAAPPIGELRFRAPQPVRPWAEVRPATEFGPSPIQLAAPWTPVDEDCLSINVVRPATDSPTPRPVMVWIFGGAYLFGGSSAVDAAALAVAGDAIVVTFNFRIGAFGFTDLSSFGTAERRFDSNIGLRDQIAALEWVQRNIASFGGDGDNVTVFGESAGAISLLALMTAPAARGLFHRAIAQSPAPGVAFAAPRHARWAEEFLAALGKGSDEPASLLSSASATRIAAATVRLARTSPRAEPGILTTSPVVDGDLLPEAPHTVLREGRAEPVPLIIGTNADEGRLFRLLGATGAIKLLPTDRRSLEALFAEVAPDLRDRVLAAYRGWPSPATIARIAADVTFWAPTVEVAAGHSRVAPTWSYRFDHVSPLMRMVGQGATHAAEVKYVFGHAGRRPGPLGWLDGGASARALSDRMMALWTTFARDGALPSSWPRYDPAERRTMVFNATDRVVADPGRAIRLAWQGYPGWEPVD